MNTKLSVKISITLLAYMALGVWVGSFLSDVEVPTSMIVVIVCLTLGAVFGMAVWVTNRFLAPVREVQRMADDLASLCGAREQVVQRDDEFNDLRRSFTHLSSRFRERMQMLEGERAKVTTILDSMVEGVIALDAQGRVMVSNPSARRILDLSQDQLEAKPLLEVVRNTELADIVESCRTLINAERHDREVVLTSPQRRILEVNAMSLPLNNQQRGSMLVLHDITELRRLEQVRSEFVANVSHELRTPLTAIKGYLETLLDESTPDPETYHRFLGVAHTHADRLGRLVNDLMNLSDIETGKIRLKQDQLSIMEVVNEVSGIYEQEAVKKGITLVNQVPPDVQVYADRDRVSQIIVNLVDNALKYTSSDGQVRFTTVLSDGMPGHVTLQIRDTGQGIPSADLPRITERFYRVDKARSREDGGTGLGLAIVKHLVHLHGGSIQIDSEVGKGTTVGVVFPVT